MKRLRLLVSLICLAVFVCFLPAGSFAEEKVLLMATTTSTDNTGLLEYLMPKFKEATGIEVKWTATGTGQALKLGENCDVDILMVHAPDAEKKFVSDGFGVDRREIMYNDFVVIGPLNDPAEIKGKSIKIALGSIKAKNAIFVSRGDNSGTHKQELALWKAADLPVPEKEPWYLQTGQGMLATINVASERNGYTMTDRGTYIKYEADMKGNLPLKILVEGDRALLNQYSVITINKIKCPKVKDNLAKQFTNWITGAKAQQLIKDFKLLGKQLFTPNAKK
ncbi:MAG: substrate-binding domain-containing protein [Pseudomonadota bacterium]